MTIPHDYEERVYAGVLGKIIGVYLGRPVEQWSYERIASEVGEVWYYLNERPDRPNHSHPLVVPDDDISGTFTFVRALPDHDMNPDLTAKLIGQTWLNFIIEGRSILWWGGRGNATEHTAYLRLREGIPAPQSGSSALNGPVIAEQIGAEIFIDGWAMVAPGDPEMAADLARRAASVSHDGEAIYGAQVIAAMEAHAFVESDIAVLLDTAVGLIPADSVIAHLIDDIREWHAAHAEDWRWTRRQIDQAYGYDRYPGNCHIVPNHALIVHSLLHGDDDFQKSLMIVTTCGWDTDCNAGNLGCLLGIKNGLADLEAGPDWRGPVADRLYLSTAEGGRAVTDALTEAYHLVRIGCALAGETPRARKDGARFHFSLPGSVQGFTPDESSGTPGSLTLENVEGHSRRGDRSLALRYRQLARGGVARAATPTFIPPEAIEASGYRLLASPTLYPGQTVTAGLETDATNRQPVAVRLALQRYGVGDMLVTVGGPEISLAPGTRQDLAWRIPTLDGQPIATIGIELRSDARADGTVYLDTLTWNGSPEMVLRAPEEGGTMWQRAWVPGVDQWEHGPSGANYLIQNRGTGLLMQGTQEWIDYRVSATVRSQLVKAMGVGARVGGMRRYYALLLCDGGMARLIKVRGEETVLAEARFPWSLETRYVLTLEVTGPRLQGWIEGTRLFDVRDMDQSLASGGVALVVSEGQMATDAVAVQPAR